MKGLAKQAAALATVAALSTTAVIGTLATPETAHATEADIIAQMDAGQSKVDVSSINYGVESNQWTSEFGYWLRNMRGTNPCLGYNIKFHAKDKTASYIDVVYDVPYDQVAGRTQAYWAEIKGICAQARGTDYERAKFVYEWLKGRCYYNWDAAGRASAYDPVYTQNCTPAAAVLDGRCICAGYARACVDLFRELGLEAWTFPIVIPGVGRHLMVGVNIDGLYCTCDPTNDDADNSLKRFMVLLDGNNYRGEKSRVNASANTARPAGSAAVSQQAQADANPQAAIAEEEPEPKYETITVMERQQKYVRTPVKTPMVPVYRTPGDLVDSAWTIYSPIVRGCDGKNYDMLPAYEMYKTSVEFMPAKEVQKTVRVN